MSLQLAAQNLAAQGRGGDSTLVHMNPQEVAGLQALARRHGTSLTINPQTGLPEALKLKDLLPAALGFALGPAGFGIMSSLGAAATVGGLTALSSGSLTKGLMAGMGAYGGSVLGEGILGAGAGAAQSAAMAGLEEGASQAVRNQAAANATQSFMSKGIGERLGSGLSATFANPSSAVASMGGGSKALQAGYMLAAPIMADRAVQTATPMPTTQNTGYIRPYTNWNPYTLSFDAQTPIKASSVGFADGGTAYAPRTSQEAFDYLMGKPAPRRAAPVIVQPFGGPREIPGTGGRYVLDPATGTYKFVADPPSTGNPVTDFSPINLGGDAGTGDAGTGVGGGTAGTGVSSPADPGDFGGESGISSDSGPSGPAPADPGDFGGESGISSDSGVSSGAVGASPSDFGSVDDGAGVGVGVGDSSGAVSAADGPGGDDGSAGVAGTGVGDSSGAVSAADGPGGDDGSAGVAGTGVSDGGDGGAGGGAGGAGCFLTTAAVQHMGQKDDGEVLNTLRHFRDNYMRKNKEKSKDVAWYYDNAPRIVAALDKAPNGDKLYKKMYKDFIHPAYEAIKDGELDYAYEIYKDGIDFAKKASGIGKEELKPRYGKHGYAAGGITALAAGGTGVAGGMRNNAFVVPADVVSALGNGSTKAGIAALNQQLSKHAAGGAALIQGPGDGLSDSIPTTIDGRKPARVADGEAYVDPQVVARLGGGNVEKGSAKLYRMMDKIRQQAHGKKTQQRPVKADRVLA